MRLDQALAARPIRPSGRVKTLPIDAFCVGGHKLGVHRGLADAALASSDATFGLRRCGGSSWHDGVGSVSHGWHDSCRGSGQGHCTWGAWGSGHGYSAWASGHGYSAWGHGAWGGGQGHGAWGIRGLGGSSGGGTCRHAQLGAIYQDVSSRNADMRSPLLSFNHAWRCQRTPNIDSRPWRARHSETTPPRAHV